MKKTAVIISMLLIVLGAVGWLTVATQEISKGSEHKNYVEEADGWAKEGLYQRAISSYELAAKEKSTEELYVKMSNAYKKRYAEAPEDTFDAYKNFLNTAVDKYCANKELVDDYYEFFMAQGKYKDVYARLVAAIDNGYNDKTIKEKLLVAKYAFKLRNSVFSSMSGGLNDIYTVGRKKGYNVHDAEDGFLFTSDYEYISVMGNDGLVVVTSKDSRIIDKTGVVMGIFKDKVTDASVYSEGLVAACCNGKYSFYNDFAEKQFGDYEAAGAFQNGLAAVKSGGKWMLVNKKGEVKSEKYDEIVLNSLGEYIVNNIIIAKQGNNYKFYDSKWKEKATIKCDDIDISTNDGKIAFCQGEKWGFVNTSGEVVIKPTYENAKSFSNGLAAVCKDGEWGFINTEGKVVIDYQFTDAAYMDSTGNCAVRTDIARSEEIVEEDAENKTDESSKTDEEITETWTLLQLELGILED